MLEAESVNCLSWTRQYHFLLASPCEPKPSRLGEAFGAAKVGAKRHRPVLTDCHGRA